MHIEKRAPGNLVHREALVCCLSWFKKINEGNKVSSHTILLIDMLLGMIDENVGGHYLQPGVRFRDVVTGYLQDFTCRVCANVLCPHGGGSDSNNTTEDQTKKTHQH